MDTCYVSIYINIIYKYKYFSISSLLRSIYVIENLHICLYVTDNQTNKQRK